MSWYRAGTVNVTNNSTTVIGVGTSWIQAAMPGETFLGPDGYPYEVTAINSNASLSINPPYKGPTSTVQAYALMPTQGYLRDLAAAAAELVASYSAVRDGVGAGKFPAGTAAAPSVRGVADENTGTNLPGNGIWQAVTGGQVRLQIGNDGTPTGVVTEKMPVSTATQAALDNLASASLARTAVGSAPNQVPAGQMLGALAFLDVLGVLHVLRHTPDVQAVAVWPEYVSDMQIIWKYRGADGVVRTRTENYA